MIHLDAKALAGRTHGLGFQQYPDGTRRVHFRRDAAACGEVERLDNDHDAAKRFAIARVGLDHATDRKAVVAGGYSVRQIRHVHDRHEATGEIKKRRRRTQRLEVDRIAEARRNLGLRLHRLIEGAILSVAFAETTGQEQRGNNEREDACQAPES